MKNRSNHKHSCFRRDLSGDLGQSTSLLRGLNVGSLATGGRLAALCDKLPPDNPPSKHTGALPRFIEGGNTVNKNIALMDSARVNRIWQTFKIVKWPISEVNLKSGQNEKRFIASVSNSHFKSLSFCLLPCE